MSLPIIIRPDAQRDIQEAHGWYGHVQDRHGRTFVEALDDAFSRISEHPEALQVIHRQARRYVLDRFPYLIIYVVTTTAIEVIAVAHGSRHPRIWRRRLP